MLKGSGGAGASLMTPENVSVCVVSKGFGLGPNSGRGVGGGEGGWIKNEERARPEWRGEGHSLSIWPHGWAANIRT